MALGISPVLRKPDYLSFGRVKAGGGSVLDWINKTL